MNSPSSATNQREFTFVHCLPPADVIDPVIEAYKQDVDVSLLRENLKLTVAERFRKFHSFMAGIRVLRQAGEKMREELKNAESAHE